jgi:methylglutaconyl-CoA hydratase
MSAAIQPATAMATDGRGVTTVTLNRPAVHNAFDEALIEELRSIFERLATDPKVRVVVLTGSGKSFSAGADLNWMRRLSQASEKDNHDDAYRLAVMLRTLDLIPRPVVARVNGAAFGGGVGLVACCDIAVASTAASFSLSEVRLGLIPAAIGPYVTAAMGARAARRYAISGERLSAADALRCGLVHEIAEPGRLDEAVAAVVTELLKGGPESQAAAKDLIRSVVHRPIDESLMRDTASRIARRRASTEGQEGVKAFLEKRQPAWIKERS